MSKNQISSAEKIAVVQKHLGGKDQVKVWLKWQQN